MIESICMVRDSGFKGSTVVRMTISETKKILEWFPQKMFES